MTLLGVSCLGHDASVAVVRDEEILFAAHAERYSGVKNDRFLSGELLNDALSYAGGAVERIAFYERPWWTRARRLSVGDIRGALARPLPGAYLKTFPQIRHLPVEYVDHHESHAASGYFTSPFDEAVVVVVDAIGERSTITIWKGVGQNLKLMHQVKYPHSIGLLYSAFTKRCGFKPNEEEYIVMGLAALGKPLFKDAISEDFIEAKPPDFRLKRSVHRGVQWWRPDVRRLADIAASIQALTEELLIDLFRWAAAVSGSNNLVFSGGVALNCKFNSLLAREGLFDGFWIMPNPGDAGSSLGAALAVGGKHAAWKGPYLGHDISRDVDVETIVRRLQAGDVVGLANGRAEFGPRALGNRSLLADPRPRWMKDRVNRIKQRELFRPFAPVVLEEEAHSLFDLPAPTSPYMQLVAGCRYPELYPAICHVDGSSRIQTLTRTQNPTFHRILSAFRERTDCPILLNTSLNIKGQPLVNSWSDGLDFGRRYGVAVF